MALVVSSRCFSWNSLTQVVTVATISVAALRAESRAAFAPGFRLARSALLIIFTFLSDIIPTFKLARIIRTNRVEFFNYD